MTLIISYQVFGTKKQGSVIIRKGIPAAKLQVILKKKGDSHVKKRVESSSVQ